MKKITLVASAVALSFITTGCATTSSNNHQSVSTENGVRQVSVTNSTSVAWDKTGANFNALDLKPNESAVVLFRVDNNTDFQTSTNITFDKELLGSIQPGQYLTLRTCAGAHTLGSEITGAKTNNLEISSYRLNSEASSVQYIAVTVDPKTNQTILKPVDNRTALKYLPGMKEQKHLVSRVTPKSCAAPVVEVVVPTPAPTPKSFTLSSDFLFDFDSTNLKAYANNEIDKLVGNIQSEYRNIKTVTVIGHTDHLGSAEYNQSLAQKRANTVKSELVRRGFNPSSIQTASMGESQPVTDGCSDMGREQAKSCLAPDRRVEVKVSGELK